MTKKEKRDFKKLLTKQWKDKPKWNKQLAYFFNVALLEDKLKRLG